MARQATRNSNASFYSNGSSSVSVARTATSDALGNASNTSYSWGLWVKLQPNFPVNANIMSKRSTNNTYITRIIVGGLVSFRLYDGVNNPVTDSTKSVNDGNWHHLVGVRSGSNLYGYVDGVLVSSNTNFTLGDVSENTTMLVHNGFTSTGFVSDAFVATTALTATEVANLYNTGTLTAPLLFRLPLSEGAGSIAYDTSGNGNNGTITSGTWSKDAPSKTRKGVNGNMVYNGDFEIAPVVNVAQTTASRYIDGTTTGSTTSNTFGWAIPGSGVLASAGVSFDSTVKRSGSYSLKLSTLDATGIAIASQALVAGTPAGADVANIQQVLPSTSYTLTAWVKTTNAATNSVYADLREHDGARASVLTTSSSKLSGTNDWTKLTVTVTTSATTRYISILLRNTVTGNISDAWFDDIQLYPTTPITRSAATAPPRRDVNNLLFNGDFEYAPAFTAATATSGKWVDGTATGSTNSSAYGWGMVVGTANAVAKFDDTVSKFGTKSLKISTLTGVIVAPLVWTGLSTSRNDVVRYTIPVLPNTSYTLTYWMKTNLTSGTSGQGAFAAISERDGVGAFIPSDTFGTRVTTTTDWTQYTVTKTTGANTRFIGVKLSVDSTVDLIMDAWFDNVSLKLTTPTGRSAA